MRDGERLTPSDWNWKCHFEVMVILVSVDALPAVTLCLLEGEVWPPAGGGVGHDISYQSLV